MAAILGFFSALPGALKLISDIMGVVKAWIDFSEKNKNEKWFQESGVVFEKIRKAETNEEKEQAVRDLAHLWRGI